MSESREQVAARVAHEILFTSGAVSNGSRNPGKAAEIVARALAACALSEHRMTCTPCAMKRVGSHVHESLECERGALLERAAEEAK